GESAAGGDAAVADRLLSSAVEGISTSRVDAPRDFLLPLCRSAATSSTLALVWPHVVNELLLGTDGKVPGELRDPTAIDELWRRLDTVPAAAKARAIERLVRLNAEREGHVLQGALSGCDAGLRNLVADLLDTPAGSAIGREPF